jgi:hypothetical protein
LAHAEGKKLPADDAWAWKRAGSSVIAPAKGLHAGAPGTSRLCHARGRVKFVVARTTLVILCGHSCSGTAKSLSSACTVVTSRCRVREVAAFGIRSFGCRELVSFFASLLGVPPMWMLETFVSSAREIARRPGGRGDMMWYRGLERVLGAFLPLVDTKACDKSRLSLGAHCCIAGYKR